MLVVVATPIGNLDDMTPGAIKALQGADKIYCEDTRTSRPLLTHFDIKGSVASFHAHNEAATSDKICSEVKGGMFVALISDAGTPAISDPGQRLVRKMREAGLQVTARPGPCSVINGLVLSGFCSEKFQFIGFLPRKAGPLKQAVIDAIHYDGSTIAFESPKRIEATLKQLTSLKLQRVGIAREMTKKFEEWIEGTPDEVAAQLTEVRGEMVIVIEGDGNRFGQWLSVTGKDHVAHLMDEYGLDKQEATKVAAKMRGVPKRELFRELLEFGE